MVLDRRKDRATDLVLSSSRELQAAGDVSAALALLEKGLALHGDEPRLLARKEALLKLLSGGRRPEEKQKDLAEMRDLKKGAFAPLSEQPFIHAILLPSGGLGLLAVALRLYEGF